MSMAWVAVVAGGTGAIGAAISKAQDLTKD
jgi:hypothetical protein